MEKKYVASEDISEKLGRKENLYNMITFDCRLFYLELALVGLFMPPLNKCSLDFLKDILSKKKPVSRRTFCFVNFIY